MTHPIPARLAPVRVWVYRRLLGAVMLAAVAFVLALFAGLGAHLGPVSSLDLLCFAVSVLALHFVWTVPLPRR